MSRIGRKSAFAAVRRKWDGLSGNDEVGARKPAYTFLSDQCYRVEMSGD